MIKKMNDFMEKLRKDNPSANWANLTTGVAVLVLVAVFSYAYFSKPQPKDINVTTPKDNVISTITPAEVKNEDSKDVTSESTPVLDDSAKQEAVITPEAGEKGSEKQMVSSDTTVVAKGEGLWDVAKRVCGDAEKYNLLADANGLSIWSGLSEGMTLKVKCN